MKCLKIYEEISKAARNFVSSILSVGQPEKQRFFWKQIRTVQSVITDYNVTIL